MYRFISSTNPECPFKRRERVTITFREVSEGNFHVIVRGEQACWETSSLFGFGTVRREEGGHKLLLMTRNSLYEFSSCQGQRLCVELPD